MTILVSPEMTSRLTKSLPQAEPEELAQIQQTICENAQKQKECVRQALFHAQQVGEALQKAKTLISHGHWESWIEQNCPFCPRTARNYISIAQNWNKLEETFSDLSELTMTGALKALKESKNKPQNPKTYVLLFSDITKFRQSISERLKKFMTIPASAWSRPDVQEELNHALCELMTAQSQLTDFIAYIKP